MPGLKSLDLTCPKCQGAKFELHLLKDESLGATKCISCKRDYLLLDSGDYWMDAIQQRPYPRPTRCTCKGTAFQLKVDYTFRDDADVRFITVWTSCIACGKSRRQLQVDIDYSPTDELIHQPLTYCEKPDLRYDLHELSLYAKPADLAKIVRFLGEHQGCQFAACTFHKSEWLIGPVSLEEAESLLLDMPPSGSHYRWIDAAQQPINLRRLSIGKAKEESTYWKRNEIIRISSPTHMHLSVNARPSLLYTISFSNEYVKGQKVIAKPQRFRNLTAKFIEWLQAEFVTWRGKDCFDNAAEHVRAFGDRFRPTPNKKTGRR